MNREQKSALITSLKNQFSESAASFVVNYNGLTVEQMQSLRKSLRAHGAHVKVAKARLMRLAAHDVPAAHIMTPFFKQQVCIVFAQNEVPSVAKELSAFAKNHEAFKIIAGSLEQRLLDEAGVNRIASLPSREVLLAQTCGTLKAPISGLVFALKGVQLKLLCALKQIGDKKS